MLVMNINAIVLAAGKGTRMKSNEPKCAHIIIDRPMVQYVIDALKEINVDNIIVVIGFGREKMKQILNSGVKFAIQDDQLGTAHAVKQAKPYLKDKEGITLITIGDMPFIKKETLESLIVNHIQKKADLTVLSVEHPQPYGYGRIIRDENNRVIEIVEDRDCTRDQAAIREINSAVYAINNFLLFKHIDEIKPSNNQNEFYLTDLIKIFNEHKYNVQGYKINDYNELSGINNKLELMKMEEEYQRKIIEKHLLDGVTIHKPRTVTIGKNVVLSPDVTIMPNTQITGKTKVDSHAILGPNTTIHNCVVNKNATVKHSIIENIIVEENQIIGPFANIKK